MTVTDEQVIGNHCRSLGGAYGVEAAGDQRGHWVHAHTEHRFVQVASHGERTWSKPFATEIVSHHTDGSLFVGTKGAAYRFDPDIPDV